MNEIIVATGNRHKVREIGEILVGTPYILTSLADQFDPIPDIAETGTTFEANARIKADWVFEKKQRWAMADDSGLEVDALDGAPGVYSARYAGSGATTSDNNKKLVAELRALDKCESSARFRCVIALRMSTTELFIAEGVCEGKVILEPRGHEGFGYDPHFIPTGHSHTFAELSSPIKHSLSHRGMALAKIATFLSGISTNQ